jgi:hypothetical protein
MSVPIVQRNPTKKEVERFRLILSTYQDGSGQLSAANGKTMPGWRDFERSVALAFGGVAQENKFIFDVLIPDPKRNGVKFGISCKMRRTLNNLKRTGRVTLELSNSSGTFWEQLNRQGINQQNYKNSPAAVARSLLHKNWNGIRQWALRQVVLSIYPSVFIWRCRGTWQANTNFSSFLLPCRIHPFWHGTFPWSKTMAGKYMGVTYADAMNMEQSLSGMANRAGS